MNTRPQNRVPSNLAVEADVSVELQHSKLQAIELQAIELQAIELQAIELEEVPFGLLIGSAWALLFTGIGALFVLSLIAIAR
ncbi:MAG: hypothetical protein ACYTG5_15680 [Planctomycetota bacterium]|jgi:hypothetical protein